MDRVLDRERLELRNQLGISPGLKIGVDSSLDRGDPQLVQSGDLGRQERVRLDIVIRVPPPHP